jgi:hypothetical protein
MFKNLAMTLESFNSTNGYAFPSVLDDNGYPRHSPTYDLYCQFAVPGTIRASDTLLVKFSGTGALMLARGVPGFSVVSGGRFVVGGTNYNLSIAGTNVRVAFRFVGSVPARLTFSFPARSRFSSMSELVICKLSDEPEVDSASTPEQMFDDEYVAIYKSLNPGVVRPMGWVGPNAGNISRARYVASWKSSINICGQRWVPSAWAGATSGVNDYACDAPVDAGKAYVDGEMIQLQFARPNSTPHVTIDSGGRGAIPVLVGAGGTVGQPPSVGMIEANSLATLTFDAILNAFLWQAGGQTACIPYELQIAFANRINVHYWCNFPTYFDDASVVTVAALVRDRLSSSLNAYFEYANEVWNFEFPVTAWAALRGKAIGFPSDNNRDIHGWYGLRFCQTMGLVTEAWKPRPSSQLRRVMAFQAFGAVSSTTRYRLQGADLSGSAYPNYAKFGFVECGTAPNRPIDICDTLSYATYYSGAQCTNFDAAYIANGAANVGGLLAAAESYASAVPPKMDAALAFIENDIRAGTLAGGTAGSQTLLALDKSAFGVGIYSAWDAVAARFNKPIECYEGGCESWYPSTVACTRMGIPEAYGGPAGKIAVLLDAFKKTDAFRAVVQDQISQFSSRPNSYRSAWLCVPGGNQWGLATDDAYSEKYESWNALVAVDH